MQVSDKNRTSLPKTAKLLRFKNLVYFINNLIYYRLRDPAYLVNY
jgi:hypothetical protein